MEPSGTIKARQIKAARALLDWSQDDLASASGLSIATIRKLEAGNISPRGKTQSSLRSAFEDGGLEFLEPDGVRHRPEEITVYQGDDGARDFLDDIYNTALQTREDVIQVWSSLRKFSILLGEYLPAHTERMIAAQDRIKVKCILTEDNLYCPSPYCEYRFLSRHFVDSVPFYVYGDKYAIIPLISNDDKKIIVIQSRAASEAFRCQFKSMWDKATPLNKLDKGENLTQKKRGRR